MMRSKLYRRASTLPAIAAALVLSSTPLRAQEAQPAPVDPPAATAPATETAPAPAVTDTAPATPDADTASSVTETKTTKTVKRSRPTAAAKPVARMTTVKAARPAAVVRTTTVSQTGQTAAPAPVAQPSAVVDVSAKPTAPVQTATAQPAKRNNDALPIAGGALAFLAIGGAAVAITRRRHADEEWEEETIEHEPVATEDPIVDAKPVVYDGGVTHEEQPAILAPSAFRWEAPAKSEEPAVRTSDETHVERAYRGPTPENPSLSLRARLKRAAFMDKREREVAAGLAEPVDPTAGLPDRMVEQNEREQELA